MSNLLKYIQFIKYIVTIFCNKALYSISLGLSIWCNPIFGLGWTKVGFRFNLGFGSSLGLVYIFLAGLHLCFTSGVLKLRFGMGFRLALGLILV